MTKNIIKHGIKKIGKNSYSGGKNIMKIIKNMYLKCIRLGRKRMWIKAVPSGVSMVVDAGSRILTSIKNIVSGRNTGNV
jgi:hypothetical protein